MGRRTERFKTKYKRWSPWILGVLLIAIVIVIVMVIMGFRFVISDESHLNWNFINVFLSTFTGSAAVIAAITIPRQLAKRQANLMLLEKREELLRMAYAAKFDDIYWDCLIYFNNKITYMVMDASTKLKTLKDSKTINQNINMMFSLKDIEEFYRSKSKDRATSIDEKKLNEFDSKIFYCSIGDFSKLDENLKKNKEIIDLIEKNRLKYNLTKGALISAMRGFIRDSIYQEIENCPKEADDDTFLNKDE